jgi:hypothetical protein
MHTGRQWREQLGLPRYADAFEPNAVDPNIAAGPHAAGIVGPGRRGTWSSEAPFTRNRRAETGPSRQPQTPKAAKLNRPPKDL